jgi:UDP-N-acetylglucosamine--N-acetylmuramyl-(pentapeptide) pyrophosphoryl-undecaprenol N-acetylglucosamine transferase
VGPIVRKTEFSREQLREKFGFESKTILVSIGGTDAGVFLIKKMLEIIPKLEKDVKVTVVAGPSLQKDFDGVKNLGFIRNLHEVIFASDVIVSLAGKSTIDEAKAYGTPGIFIPIKDHFEQEDNAKNEGFSYDDLQNLETLISEKLAQSRNPIAVDGAQKAYDLLKKVLS